MDVDHALKTNLSRRKIQVLLFHEFPLGCRATETTNNICRTTGEHILFIRTAQHWFNRFKNNILELADWSPFGRPLELNMDL